MVGGSTVHLVLCEFGLGDTFFSFSLGLELNLHQYI